MASTDVRMARLQARSAERQALLGVGKAVVSNPILSLLIGLAVVEAIPWDDSKYEAGSSKVWARSAVKTVAVCQAIAPMVPTLASASADIIGSLTKAAPGVAAALAAGFA